MAKKKNKGSKNNSSTPKIVNPQSIENFSDDQMFVGYEFEENELPEEAKAISEEQLSETTVDSTQVENLKKTGNVEQYVNYLRGLLKRLRAIEKVAEDTKNSNLAKEEQLDKRLSSLNQELDAAKNDREFYQVERLKIERGEYSSLIKSLLDELSNTEKAIVEDTRSLVEEMRKKHEKYITDLKRITEERDKLEEDKLDLEKREHELERKSKRSDAEKKSFERRITDQAEDKFQDEIDQLKEEKSSLERTVVLKDKEIKNLKSFKDNVTNAFSSTNVEDVILKQKQLDKQNSELIAQLETYHSENEFSSKLEEIRILNEKISSLEKRIDEQRLSELRLSLFKADESVLEINMYKAKIDAADAREKSLLRTVNDLQQMVNRLKDEEHAKESAFEHTKAMDIDAQLQGSKMRTHTPKDLSQLVNYLQVQMTRAPREEDKFYYDLKTIRTFIAGIHMSPLTLLQGISGTGKTSLPIEVAKALVAFDDSYVGLDKIGNRKEPYRICAIQSGWRDNMDLMGFYNNFEKKYKETDFFQAIYLAAQPKYKDVLFFIILDEMNLSHPEHYFSDFLSMIEQKVKDRYIKINADLTLLPVLFKGSNQILLPENIRFIGTANHDETTMEFAPKTYDRSNVIVMETNDKEKVKKEIEGSEFENSSIKFSVNYQWLLDQFALAEESYSKFGKEFEKFIKDDKEKSLKKLLKERGIGIGNRFSKQATRFISAYMAAGGSFAEAADHLITSRLLRSLKNRYELKAKNLEDFIKDYEATFSKFEPFNHAEPTSAKLLIAEELKNK